MNIGLYFGTFDPIHRGHINIVNFLIDNSLVEKVWFVVTPESPDKSSNNLTNSILMPCVKSNYRCRQDKIIRVHP